LKTATRPAHVGAPLASIFLEAATARPARHGATEIPRPTRCRLRSPSVTY